MAKAIHYFSLEYTKTLVNEARESKLEYLGKFRLAVITAVAHAIKYGNCSPLNDIYANFGKDVQTPIREFVKKINAVDARQTNMLSSPANIFGFNREKGYFIKSNKEDAGAKEARLYFVPDVAEDSDVETAQKEVVEFLADIWERKPEEKQKEEKPLIFTEFALPRVKRIAREIATKFPETNKAAHDLYIELNSIVERLERVLNVKPNETATIEQPPAIEKPVVPAKEKKAKAA